jgi:hypothetical protein
MVQEQNNEDCVAVPKASVGAGGMNCGTGSTLNAYRGPSHETSFSYFVFADLSHLSFRLLKAQSPKVLQIFPKLSKGRVFPHKALRNHSECKVKLPIENRRNI